MLIKKTKLLTVMYTRKENIWKIRYTNREEYRAQY